MKIHKSAIISIKKLSHNPLFQDRHKNRQEEFSRQRKLPFPTIVGMLFRMVKNSLQISCNWLGDMIGAEPASKQAFSQARRKISPECFKEFHEDGLRVNYKLTGKKGLWKGFRLIAADGSTVRLPESEELAKEFGRCKSKPDQTASPPMARISEFTDMTSKLVLSGRIAPYNVSENALAEEQLLEVVEKMRGYGQKKLLFVYDRGYPSEKFMRQHIELGVDFLFRVPKNFNNAIREIQCSNDPEHYLLKDEWPMLRTVQFTLASGEEELLLTTLTDDKLFTQKELSSLYHGRWIAMEEGYKRQKITMQLENFSGKTFIAIAQEYWATLVVANLLEMGCIEIEGYWMPGKQPKYQVNRSVLFGSMRDATIKVIFGLMAESDYHKKFYNLARRAMIKVKPGRKYSRNGLHKPKRHHTYRRSC